jgi:hypothetical protein
LQHATNSTLDRIETFLENVRKSLPMLIEKKRGVFYLKSRAFMHFHEEGGAVYCDTSCSGEWSRTEITSKCKQQELLERLKKEL